MSCKQNPTHLERLHVIVTNIPLVAKPSIVTIMSTSVSSLDPWFTYFCRFYRKDVLNPKGSARRRKVPVPHQELFNSFSNLFQPAHPDLLLPLLAKAM